MVMPAKRQRRVRCYKLGFFGVSGLAKVEKSYPCTEIIRASRHSTGRTRGTLRRPLGTRGGYHNVQREIPSVKTSFAYKKHLQFITNI